MQIQLLLLSSLACLSTSMVTRPFGPHTLAYFESLGGRYGMVRKFRENMATCKDYDIGRAEIPSSNLPTPAAGSKVVTVAIGTGTQNYTCLPGNPSATPIPFGAVARLYNVTCSAAVTPESTRLLPAAVLENGAECITKRDTLFPAGPLAEHTGNHYFADNVTAVFNFHTPVDDYFIIAAKKTANVTATKDYTSVGDNNNNPVAWLQLQTLATPPPPFVSEKGTVPAAPQQVYRVNVAGGAPPPTCADLPSGGVIEIPYAAEYWFFAPSP